MLLGGFGFLSRLHGLSIDNLVEAEVVMGDGTIAIVNEKEHPGTPVAPFSAISGLHMLTMKV
jgi:FAD/FMN-containing dehydrogenase